MILTIFDLQITPMLPTKFQVSCPFISGEEAKNIFFQIAGHPGFPIGTILATFDQQVTLMFLPSFKSIGFSDQEEVNKTDFQDGGHLGFPIREILAIFDLQVTLILPAKFQVNWPFSSGGNVNNRFSRWRSWRPAWFSDPSEFCYF